jgi:hypothetical protein
MNASDKVVRNLTMHIWPVRGTGVWQWNVSQVLRRMRQFNGQRVVSVVTDGKTDTLAAVVAAFQGTIPRSNFIHSTNDPTIGEVVGFHEMMRRVENIDPRQQTFYCHAKGVRYPLKHKYAPQVRKWAGVMYESLLDHPALIDQQMKTFPVTGSFLKASPGFSKVGCEWHYSGTFFWFNNKKVFSQASWERLARAYWGVEAWPGLICPLGMAGSVFSIDRPMGWALYEKKFWEDNVVRKWKGWQIEHCNLRRTQSYQEVLGALRLDGKLRVVVSGPQRSGTTIAAKMLAADLGFKYIDEMAFGTHDIHGLMRELKKPRVVIHAPALSRFLELIPNASIVWMRRALTDVLLSQRKLGLDIFAHPGKPFEQNEDSERDAYGEHSSEPLAAVKTRYWEQFQRIHLGDRAFDLDYDTLNGHPMWVDSEARKEFHRRQTYPCPPNPCN